MPWNGTGRFALGIFTVLKQAPPESGVYALLSGERWVDIEEAENIQVRLLTHLNGPDPSILQHDVTSFVFERVPAEARKARQKELVAEFKPAYP